MGFLSSQAVRYTQTYTVQNHCQSKFVLLCPQLPALGAGNRSGLEDMVQLSKK